MFQSMVLRQTMYYLIFQGLLKTCMPWVYEVIISNVSKTNGVYVNFSDVASAVNVLTLSILYSDDQIPIQQYTSYNMDLLKRTLLLKIFSETCSRF